MKNKILIIAFIIVLIIALLFVKTKYSDYNLEKTVSACVMAKKQTSKSFDQEKAKKQCEETIKKQVKKLF
jgi:mannitol-specific phosphotransferase system IIBC component